MGSTTTPDDLNRRARENNTQLQMLRRGDWYYNITYDDPASPGGIWRRVKSEHVNNPDDHWDVLVDSVMLGDGHVIQNAKLEPTRQERALVIISKDGGDAAFAIEFDLDLRTFCRDQDWFRFPESICDYTWLDEDHIVGSVAFPDDEDETTEYGYPRKTRIFHRDGSEGELILAIDPSHVAPEFEVEQRSGWVIISDHETIYDFETYAYRHDRGLNRLNVPKHVTVTPYGDDVCLTANKTVYLNGMTLDEESVTLVPIDDLIAGSAAEARTLHRSEPGEVVQSVEWTKNYCLVSTTKYDLSQVTYVINWDGERINEFTAGSGTLLNVMAVDATNSDDVSIRSETVTSPPRVDVVAATQGRHYGSMYTVMDSARTSGGYVVPYIVTDNAKSVPTSPVLIDVYGGFGITPSYDYSPEIAEFVENYHGIHVTAHVSGGSEYGEKWRLAGSGTNKINAVHDLVTVAHDLVSKGYARPGNIYLRGISNGGLVVTRAAVERPDLFGGIIVGCAIIDMLNYTDIGIGSSWVSEYGDPDDPDDREALKFLSPIEQINSGTFAINPRIRFLVWNAVNDNRLGREHSDRLVTILRTNGVETEHLELPGGHEDHEHDLDLLARQLDFILTTHSDRHDEEAHS